MTDQNGENEIKKLKITQGYNLSLIGLFIAGVITLFLVMSGFHEASDIVAIVGLFTSILGTLVGAFLGVSLGSQETEVAQKAAARNREMAFRALLAVPPESSGLDDIRQMMQEC